MMESAKTLSFVAPTKSKIVKRNTSGVAMISVCISKFKPIEQDMK